MKQYLNTMLGVIALIAGTTSLSPAADYAELSNEELAEVRSQAPEMAPADRDSYRTEMQSRMQSMSSEERDLFRSMNEMSERGNGSGKMNRYGQGSGDGSGNKNRRGQGNGSGNMYGYDQSGSQEYGSGYGTRQGGGGGYGGGRGRNH